MTEQEKNERKLMVQQALAVASLGGKTVSEKELQDAGDYVEGKIDLKTLEERADVLEYAVYSGRETTLFRFSEQRTFEI